MDEFAEAIAKATSPRRKNGKALKIILFGRYVRDDWVDDPENGYQSDFDLLVVVDHDDRTDIAHYWYVAEDMILRDAAIVRPMRIHGRGGVELSDAWRHGAMAYLGLSVPDFPNFFMLYGPDTNLGHNSIVYMLESQIAHVVACLRHRRRIGAAQVEVRTEPYASVNANVQTRLARTVWNGCKSWYVDANGHNSTNWPGFTFTYRRMVKRPDLAAYRFATPVAGLCDAYAIAEPAGRGERLAAGGLRAFLRASFRPLIAPPLGRCARNAASWRCCRR